MHYFPSLIVISCFIYTDLREKLFPMSYNRFVAITVSAKYIFCEIIVNSLLEQVIAIFNKFYHQIYVLAIPR